MIGRSFTLRPSHFPPPTGRKLALRIANFLIEHQPSPAPCVLGIAAAMTAINDSQVKILEQTRQRLLHLTHSLDSLTGSLHHSDPLPSWYLLPYSRQTGF